MASCSALHVAVTWAALSTLLLVGLCSGCGHDHGIVLERTSKSAQRHLMHKAMMRRMAQGEASSGKSMEAAGPQRRAMQQAVAGPLLQQIVRLWNSSNIMSNSLSTSASIATPVPLRINVEYQSVQASFQPDIQAVTAAVIAELQTFLSVRVASQAPLLVTPICYIEASNYSSCIQLYPTFNSTNATADSVLDYCGLARINPAHVLDPATCKNSSTSSCDSFAGGRTGVVTDFYLYVTSIQDQPCSNGAAAWAQPCLYDPVTNRPTMGTANICPGALQLGRNALTPIVIHEVHHSLGFTNSMFPLFVDPTTNQELGTALVSAQEQVGGQLVTRVITPTVAREARAQFNCSSLDGAQLEDQGGSGSVNSHWEYTHYQGELMVATTLFATSGEAPRISRLTLAFMEDSGWYIGNWTRAGGPMQWGRNAGCMLPQQGCQAFIAGASPASKQMFCDLEASKALGSKLANLVSSSLRSVGPCSNVTFGNGCGLVYAQGASPSCTELQYQYPNSNVFGWEHITTSRAYPVTYKFAASNIVFPASGNAGDLDATCWPTVCQGNQAFLQVGGQSVRCPSGQYLDLSAALPNLYHQGLVGPCPDEALVCATLNCGGQACSPAGGSCYDGSCICQLGWTGADCGISLAGVEAPSLPPPSTPTITPSPLASQNQTVWVQVLTLSLQLPNTTLLEVLAHTEQLTGVVATWAGVSVFEVTNVTATVVALTGSLANVIERRRQLRITASTLSTSTIQVTATIQPSIPGQATAIASRLANTTQQAHLVQQLTAASFQVEAASLSSRVSLVQQTVTTLVATPESQNSTDTATVQTIASTNSTHSQTWLIIFIACGVAGGVALFAGVLATVAYVRNRMRREVAAAAARVRSMSSTSTRRGDKSSAPGSTRPPKSIRHSGGGSLPISTNSSGLSPLCLSSNRSGPLRQSSTGTGALRQSGNGSGSLRQSEAGAAPLPPAALHSLPSAPPLPVALQWGDGFVEIRRTGTVLRAPSLTPPAQVATAAQVFDSAHATPRFS